MPAALLAALRGLGPRALAALSSALSSLSRTSVGSSAAGVYAGIRSILVRNPRAVSFVLNALSAVGITIAADKLLSTDDDEEVRKTGTEVAPLPANLREQILRAIKEANLRVDASIAKHSGDGSATTVDGEAADQYIRRGVAFLADLELAQTARQRCGLTWDEVFHLRMVLAMEPELLTLAREAELLGSSAPWTRPR